MMNLISRLLWSLTFFAALLSACESELEETEEKTDEDIAETISDATENNAESHEAATDYVWNESQVVAVQLNGSTATTSGSGVKISGGKITVSSAGTYKFSGTLTDGQIIVNTTDETIVRLILNGATITCSNSAPVNIEKAAKTMIVLADNTENTFTDGVSYQLASGSDEPNAAVFSKSDLTIYGTGTLVVDANYNDGITSKDGLILKSGIVKVDAKDDGIRGKDYLIVDDGTVQITSGGDGLKSDNEDDTDCGYILIKKLAATIVSGGDAISANTDVMIEDGNYAITSGGGSSKTVSSDLSCKGIKGVVNLIVDKGTFSLNCADDAIHSNGAVVVNDGTFTISTGDDGLHADSSLKINGGDITISKSYEGIESKIIEITSGTIRLKSSDDGVNVADGSGAEMGGGWPGGNMNTSTSSNLYLRISGGYIYVNAGGDGIDVNGSIEMSGGTVIVDGPTSNGNGSLDYDRSFKITGGFLLAAGSSGMAQAPDTSSSQNSILLNFTSTKQAGTIIRVQTTEGKELFTYSPAKSYQSVAFSSPDLAKNTSYDIYFGGSSTGTVVDGLYKSGVYSSGTKSTSFTVSSTTTKVSVK